MLEGVRVVEMGMWLAGPAAGGVLSDWGADVVKVEPVRGDPMRRLYGRMSGSSEQRCPPFDLHNRGKRSVALDVNTSEGQAIVARLAAGADVFLTNMRPSFLRRVGLDHETLMTASPRLVYALLTGYGMEGPDAENAGYDVAAYGARGGVADRCTPEGAPPAHPPAGMGDAITGIVTTAAILAGLVHRDRSGEGQLVSTSLMRTGVWCVGLEVATRLGLDRLRPPPDRTAPDNPLMNSYAAGDGRWFWLMGAESDRHWPDLMAALGNPAYADDERFQSRRERRNNGRELVALLDAAFAEHPRDEWARRFADAGMWWSPVNTVEDLLADPQVAAAGAFVEGPDDGRRVLASPVSFSGHPIDGTRPVPGVGADTDAVLAEAGVSSDDVAGLREAGVLGGG